MVPDRRPIPDGDAPGTAFDRADYRTSRLTGTVPVSVTLSKPSAQTVTVGYATRDQSAIASVHYLTSTGTLTFAPSVTLRNFAVPVRAPTFRSVTRTLTLGLSTPRSAVLTAPVTATLYLTPYEPPGIMYLPVVFSHAFNE